MAADCVVAMGQISGGVKGRAGLVRSPPTGRAGLQKAGPRQAFAKPRDSRKAKASGMFDFTRAAAPPGRCCSRRKAVKANATDTYVTTRGVPVAPAFSFKSPPWRRRSNCLVCRGIKGQTNHAKARGLAPMSHCMALFQRPVCRFR